MKYYQYIMNTTQPKTNYQDFLKDIYSAMKKINQTTTDIFTRLDNLDNKIANLEKSYILLSNDVKELLKCNQGENIVKSCINTSKQRPDRLLSLLTQLNNDNVDNNIDVIHSCRQQMDIMTFTDPVNKQINNINTPVSIGNTSYNINQSIDMTKYYIPDDPSDIYDSPYLITPDVPQFQTKHINSQSTTDFMILE